MHIPRIISTTALLAWVFCILSPSYGAAPNDRIEITGDYRYAVHDAQADNDATALACLEAWRLAVSNSALYREQTAYIVDSTLLRDLVNTLAATVQDPQIVEQTQRGRTVTCRVRGYLPTMESVRVIRTQLAGTSAEGVEQNRALKIVGTKEAGGYLLVQFQALKRLDWLNTAYQGSLRESADIMVDFFDDAGLLIRTERHPARHSGTNQDVMNPGMFGLLRIPKPLAAKSYRVWVVK